MNVEDQVTYLALKSLQGKKKIDRTAFKEMLKEVNQVDPNSSHLVADTLRLIDIQHNQFLNCKIKLKNPTTPVPEVKSGNGQGWITPIGNLELKRLIFDYKS